MWLERAKVSEWMVSPVESLHQNASLFEAAGRLERLGADSLPVLDDNQRLIGMLCVADLYAATELSEPGPGPLHRVWRRGETVRRWLTGAVPVTGADVLLSEGCRRMIRRGLHRLYVVADGPLLGVLTTHQLTLAAARTESSAPLSSLSEVRLETVAASESMFAAAARLESDPALALIVEGEAGPVGVLSPREIRLGRGCDPDIGVESYAERNVLWFSRPQVPACVAAHEVCRRSARYVVVEGTDGPPKLVSLFDFARVVLAALGQAP